MAGIIEKYASEEVTLLQVPVVSDGKTTFIQSIGAKAIVMDFSQVDFDYFGWIQNGKVFYVSLLDAPPPPAGQDLARWKGIRDSRGRSLQGDDPH